jgi:hypothetical protein
LGSLVLVPGILKTCCGISPPADVGGTWLLVPDLSSTISHVKISLGYSYKLVSLNELFSMTLYVLPLEYKASFSKRRRHVITLEVAERIVDTNFHPSFFNLIEIQLNSSF